MTIYAIEINVSKKFSLKFKFTSFEKLYSIGKKIIGV